ncbi:MAG: DEAD/DEAH box helicase [candidate division WOR-3 bacterium]
MSLLIKEKLKKTWFPFFARFGKLTEVQKKAIPLILEGNNLLVISPAATGKTEAVLAPVIELVLRKWKGERPAILYISPTRALVNDLFRRLENPLQELNLSVKRKTGDRPTFSPRGVRLASGRSHGQGRDLASREATGRFADDEKNPPFLLLTTPESFDSLLGRHPRVFKNVKAVILDELHLLDSSPRGDQLRCLLKRLSLINPSIQYCALSATIEDKKMGERYFPKPIVCEVKEKREIDYQLFPILLNEKGKITVKGIKELGASLFSYFQKKSLKKILFFFNARSLAELFSRYLSWGIFEKRVWVHHASLPKEKREEIERIMNQEKVGILCATSTLELGIDIGDIDCVCQYRPPFSISSLLQRIGRGNRRRDKIFAIGIYENPFERLLFEIFFEGAKEGRFYEKPYRKSLSALPQQIISYAFQRKRIGTTLDSLFNAFSPRGEARGTPIYTQEEIEKVFSYLLEKGFLISPRTGIYFLSPQLEKKIEWGKIHTNIQEKSFGEYQVINLVTGKEIGMIYYPKERFILGGRTWEKIEIKEKEKKIFARPLGEEKAEVKIFEGTGTGGYFYLLAEVIKHKLFPNLREKEFPYFREGEDFYLFHFLGPLYGSLLQDTYQMEGWEVMDIEGKIFQMKNGAGKKLPVPKKETIEKWLKKNLFFLEDALGVSSFFRLLPEDLKIKDLAITLDISGFIEFIKTVEIIEQQKEFCLLMLEGHIGNLK